MARTHVQTEPGRTACGRDATGVQLEGVPDCRTCLRVAPPPEPTVLEAALAVAQLGPADQVAVQLLRDTLEALEDRQLPGTARAALTGRALQLLVELELTPGSRSARDAADEPDPGTARGRLQLVRDRRS